MDGRGTPIDDWMRETLAPLLLVLGCLDVCLDHPKAPPGREDHARGPMSCGSGSTVRRQLHPPQNMVWWRTDAAGRYLECLVREYQDPSDRIDHRQERQRDRPRGPGQHRRGRGGRTTSGIGSGGPTESILFTYDGDEILERVPHSFGRVPIVRLVDLPKHRTPHIGK